jgi:predicted GNAT family N-acyltransferase
LTSFARPRAITPADDVSEFGCGEQSLDNWLHFRAIKNEADGNSRTFVAVERESGIIAGYYCLSSHSLMHDEATSSLRRNSPNPIPVILIGRLAVDERFRAMGLGASLLQDAIIKGLEAAQLVGSRAFLVHALNQAAVEFYQRYGFESVPDTSHVMYLLMKDAVKTVADAT